jgi:DNA-binding Lrp family transcriptional regulator
MNERIDATDRRLIAASQAGLPLCPRPFDALAAELGVTTAEVMHRFDAMASNGIVRRIAAVPNHYALGYRANGMSVWDVADDRVDAVGARLGALDFVSHCYTRPRHPPQWPYNLFAMVHGRVRAEVADRIAVIAALIGADCRGHDVLYSTRILKKQGLRLAS